MNGVYWFILAFGVLFCVIAAGLLGSQKRKTGRCSEKTTGTVVGYVPMRGGVTNDDITTEMWHPVFEYYASGRHIKKTGAVGSVKKKYDIGEQVEVFFDPDEPEKFYIAGERAGRLLSVIFAAIGVLAIVVAVVLSRCG